MDFLKSCFTAAIITDRKFIKLRAIMTTALGTNRVTVSGNYNSSSWIELLLTCEKLEFPTVPLQAASIFFTKTLERFFRFKLRIIDDKNRCTEKILVID